MPRWSPTGRYIAFLSGLSPNGDLHMADTAGSELIKITNTPYDMEFYPQWSPDGMKIVFLISEGYAIGPLMVIDIFTREVTVLSADARPGYYKYD
jgi:Tol biopolymer transport system component